VIHSTGVNPKCFHFTCRKTYMQKHKDMSSKFSASLSIVAKKKKKNLKNINNIKRGDGYFYFDNADGITGVCICTNLLKHTYQRCTTFCMYQLYLPIKIDDR